MNARLSALAESVRQQSIRLDDVSQVYDAVVIGAGPAGAVASRQVARGGASVLLVDRARFPRTKVCGCCLSAQALRELAKLKLGRIPEQLGAVPLRQLLVGAADGNRLAIPLHESMSVSRHAFDLALVDAALADGVHFCDETVAHVQESGVDERTVELQSNGLTKTVRCGVVVLADGLGGTAAGKVEDFACTVSATSRVGTGAISYAAPSFYEGGTIFMAYGEAGYLGLVRLEDGGTDIAAALDPHFVRRHGSAAAAAASLLKDIGWPVPGDLHEISWRGTVTLTRQRTPVSTHRMFAIGDAASYVEPFTGEGIAWALASAASLAPLVVEGVKRWDDSLVWHWQHVYRRTITRRQRPTRYVAALLRHPRAAAAVSGLLKRLPVLRRNLVGAVIGS